MKKSRSRVLAGLIVLCFLLSTVFYPLTVFAETNSSVPLLDTIQRIYGQDRYETAVKVSQEGWKEHSEFAVLASGNDENLVDALTAAPLAYAKKAPILLTESNRLNPLTEKELKRLEVSKVFIISGTQVITAQVTNRLRELGIEVIFLGGVDRYATAVNIAKQLGEVNELVITTGLSNADALSIASIAAFKGMPILLTEKDRLPIVVSDYLSDVKGTLTKTYVLGGIGAISSTVEAKISNTKRIAGSNRYLTNLEILKYFANELKYHKYFLANGEDKHLVDALVGSPWAAITSSPVLLTATSLSNEAKEFAHLNLSPNVVALGGDAVLSRDVLNQLVLGQEYGTDGATLGSSTSSNLEVYPNYLILKGKNSKLENAVVSSSVYLKGNGIVLSHVTVKGTIFVDPGENGYVYLDDVDALRIVILSGRIYDYVPSSGSGGGSHSVTIRSIDSISQNVAIDGTEYTFPQTVTAKMSDGSTKEVAVTWSNLDSISLEEPGQYRIEGTVEGFSQKVILALNLYDATKIWIKDKSVDPINYYYSFWGGPFKVEFSQDDETGLKMFKVFALRAKMDKGSGEEIAYTNGDADYVTFTETEPYSNRYQADYPAWSDGSFRVEDYVNASGTEKSIKLTNDVKQVELHLYNQISPEGAEVNIPDRVLDWFRPVPFEIFPTADSITLSRPIPGAVESDFSVTAWQGEVEINLENLQYNSTEHQFTFGALNPEEWYGIIDFEVQPAEGAGVDFEPLRTTFNLYGFGGQITNLSGEGVPDMPLMIFEGSNTEGTSVLTVTTDSEGYYAVALPYGTYTMVVGGGDYITHNVVVEPTEWYQDNLDVVAIPRALEGEIRIVLTWNNVVEDLDSHLFGPTPMGEDRFHVYYSDEEYVYGDQTYVVLDVDDTDGVGPETTTIKIPQDGVYRFYVHNYDQYPEIYKSQAKVQVFLGTSDEPAQTIDIPTTGNYQLYWNVFELTYENGQPSIVVKNELVNGMESLNIPTLRALPSEPKPSK